MKIQNKKVKGASVERQRRKNKKLPGKVYSKDATCAQ